MRKMLVRVCVLNMSLCFLLLINQLVDNLYMKK